MTDNTPPPERVEAVLLPCPFCGSSNIDAHGWKSLTASGPACDDCGASAGEIAADHAANVTAWNTRSTPEPTPDAGLADELLSSAYYQGYRDGHEDGGGYAFHADTMREGFAQWQADNQAALREPRHEPPAPADEVEALRTAAREYAAERDEGNSNAE